MPVYNVSIMQRKSLKVYIFGNKEMSRTYSYFNKFIFPCDFPEKYFSKFVTIIEGTIHFHACHV